MHSTKVRLSQIWVAIIVDVKQEKRHHQRRDEECRQMLQKSIAHRPFYQFSRDWLIRDPDLERVREQAWFQALQQG